METNILLWNIDNSVLNTRSTIIITKTKSTYPFTSDVKRFWLIQEMKPWSLPKSNSSTKMGMNKGIATTRSVAVTAIMFPSITSFLYVKSCWNMPLIVHDLEFITHP